ncbi:MAG: homoserine kinase [Acidobacteriota bacterium]
MTAAASITAFAPASLANLSCGFDVLGLALDGPGDRVRATCTAEAGVSLGRITGDDGRLPRDVARNTATVAAAALLARHAPDRGVRLDLDKGLPLCSGLGGSAASAVAAVCAVDAVLGAGLALPDLLTCALEGEKTAAGAGHADNAAACLYGGLILARVTSPPEIIRLPVPADLWIALIRPHVEVSTADARVELAERVPLAVAAAQWGDVGAFVHAVHVDDWELLGRCLRDQVAEPQRAGRVPGFAAVKQAALDGGATGCGLSGSGPSLFALCRGRAAADAVVAAMATAFQEVAATGCDRHVGAVDRRGARVVAA